MWCTNCGLPISPSRANSNCPRCGAITVSNQKPGATSRPQDFEEPGWGNAGGIVGGEGTLQDNPWNQGQAAQYSPFPTTIQPPAGVGNPGNWPGTAEASSQVQREIQERTPAGAMWNMGAGI